MIATLLDALAASRRLGFLGPGPVEDHLHHARAFARAVPDAPGRAVDLGTGGGLPGLVLAAECWPATRWWFVDAQARRTEFLREAVAALGLDDRVDVVTGRAEEVGRSPLREAADLVVARSFGAPAVTAECAAPLLAVGGHLVVSEPPAADRAVRWPDAGLAALGLAFGDGCVDDQGDQPVHLAVLAKVAPSDERHPRRTGVPGKRPLW